MSDPTNKAELLAQMRQGYTDFEALLAPLSAEQLSEPGLHDGWSIKDTLVHLTAWQNRVSLRLEAIARHDEKLPFEVIDSEEKMHAFNNSTFAANRTRPLDEVQANFRASVERLIANVEATDERDLFDAQRLTWTEGEPFWTGIAGNSFGHYEEHTALIKAWLARQ